MAAPSKSSLSSFINSSQYTTQTIGSNPLIAGLLAGGTGLAGYTPPNFNTSTNATSQDPGGLFGWLTYARTLASSSINSTPKGVTYDTYIVYTNPSELVGDLNLLGDVPNNGATACLVGSASDGVTYGFFLNNSSVLSPKTAGKDFLHAITYLAYGGTLVITGTTAGFDNYETTSGKKIDVLIGNTANASLATWLNTKQYTVGIFPSSADANGVLGAGYTMANFDTFAGSSYVATGNTFSTRVFTVMGLHTFVDIDTSSLIPGSKMEKTSLAAVGDVAGFFTRSKANNSIFVSIAGKDNSTVLNDSITNPIEWSNTSLKNKLRNNRVNFFINSTEAFLGQDLVGATATTSAVTPVERIGASELRMAIDKDVTQIALNYLYRINNEGTRSTVTSVVRSYIGKYNPYLDPSQTQIICDGTNNIDNSTTLNVTVIVKPILSSETIVVTTSLTA
jgi:hypothetical protein